MYVVMVSTSSLSARYAAFGRANSRGGIWPSGARDSDLSSKSVVDHYGAFKECSPEKDSMCLPSGSEPDASEPPVLIQFQTGN